MFHIVTLNGVDSGNAVTLTCLPSFQAEVWPTVLVILRAWAQRSVRVGFSPPERLDVQITRPCLFFFFFGTQGLFIQKNFEMFIAARSSTFINSIVFATLLYS